MKESFSEYKEPNKNQKTLFFRCFGPNVYVHFFVLFCVFRCCRLRPIFVCLFVVCCQINYQIFFYRPKFSMIFGDDVYVFFLFLSAIFKYRVKERELIGINVLCKYVCSVKYCQNEGVQTEKKTTTIIFMMFDDDNDNFRFLSVNSSFPPFFSTFKCFEC